MELTTISGNVIAAIIGGLALLAIQRFGKILFKRKVAIPLAVVFLMGMIVSGFALAFVNISERLAINRDKQTLEDTIEKYVRGNYPDAFKVGYSIDVIEIEPRVFLGLYSPNSEIARGTHNPLDLPWVKQEIGKIVNNQGYPGEPLFGHTLAPMTTEDMDRLLSDG